jgi:ABC-type lipoprotein release transport system permease subunit
MKRFLKKYERMLSLHHYVAVLKRQPAHMQHVYAALFAGTITFVLAVGVLYFDYGFWSETYSRHESSSGDMTITSPQEEITTQSPKDMMNDFFKEASKKLQAINVDKKEFFNSKETYIKEGE